MNADGWAILYGHDLKAFTFDRGHVANLVHALHGIVKPMIYQEQEMLDPRSERNLTDVHPALVGVVRRAAEIVVDRDDGLGFIVTEGLRSRERQVQLVRVGASQTMNSKHLAQSDGLSHAVDLAATVTGIVRWDFPLYDHLADAMKAAAGEQGVQIEWGGDWVSFRDGPHWQLADQTHAA